MSAVLSVSTPSPFGDEALDLRPLDGRIGAEVRGLRLSGELDADMFEACQLLATSRLIQAEHPLVRLHPETGERTLVAGHFLKKFLGFNTQDSQQLIAVFQNHITRLENTVRWQWTESDVAIWDNRATQHYAINDYGDAHRVMRRVTVAGEPTVAIDGQRGRPHGGIR